MKKEKKEKFLGLRLTKAQLKILEEVTDLYNKENSTELNVQDMIRLMLTKGCDVLKQG